MMLNRTWVVVILLGLVTTSHSPAQSWQLGQAGSMAVFGDSISTGAGTHPALEYDPLNLWQVMSGSVDVSAGDNQAAPTIVLPAAQEFKSGAEWFLVNYGILMARYFLNTEQFSWAYDVGERFEIAPENRFFAAENGARVRDFPKQLDRLLAATGGELPDKLFLFFTGNDLCGGFAAEQVAADLRRGLAYLLRTVQPTRPVDVYVVGYLGLLQLITSEAIATKQVQAFGLPTSCGDLRERFFQPAEEEQRAIPDDAVYRVFKLMMPPNPVNICSGLFFDTHNRGDESITQIANLIRAYRRQMKEVVQETNVLAAELRESTTAQRSVPRFYWLEKPGSLVFGADDIAGDCFHLSRQGQKKVAASIWEELTAR